MSDDASNDSSAEIAVFLLCAFAFGIWQSSVAAGFFCFFVILSLAIIFDDLVKAVLKK